MKKLAYWAKRNPIPARLIIVFVHFFLGVAGVEGGLFLFAKGIELPRIYFWIPFAIFSAAYLAYPFGRQFWWGKPCSFGKRKLFDSLLFGSLALLWLFGGNALPARLAVLQTHQATVNLQTPVAQSMLPAAKEDVARGLKKVWRIGKKGLGWFSDQVAKRLDKYRSKDSSGKIIGLIFLGIVLTLALLYLTAAISCNVSCSGNETAAGILVILGIGAIVVMWILFIKMIRKMRNNAQNEG